MLATDSMPTWLAEYEPQLPLAELVEQTNQIFHEFEARFYDRLHQVAAKEWTRLWEEMIAVALRDRPQAQWRILDFGCGTGFASSQLLRGLPAGSVAALTCYDLSTHMLQRCRTNLAGRSPAPYFCNRLEEVRQFAPFNLLATNSLLHHLPDPEQTLRELQPLLTRDAVWLAGHEPSRRFFQNEECMKLLQSYRRSTRRGGPFSLLRYLTPGYWSHKFQHFIAGRESSKKLTARQTVERGLFKRLPPPHLIDRLVDFHVPHSPAEVSQGRGFDVQQLKANWAGSWNLHWVKSYSFLGGVAENTLSARWRHVCQQLTVRYPLDGANFCAVWLRAGTASVLDEVS